MNLSTSITQPTAFLPFAMSCAALTMTLAAIAVFGVVGDPAADEGTLAHIFQLLLAAQLPIMAFFAIQWLPKAPKEAMQILVLQVGAALAAFAPVYFLDL